MSYYYDGYYGQSHQAPPQGMGGNGGHGGDNRFGGAEEADKKEEMIGSTIQDRDIRLLLGGGVDLEE